jgi:hypothetical protein
MARGFESKDVEYQQAEAQRSKPRIAVLSPELRAAADRRRTVELALTRARAELAVARSAAHRQMLERAIGALEQQLESSE